MSLEKSEFEKLEKQAQEIFHRRAKEEKWHPLDNTDAIFGAILDDLIKQHEQGSNHVSTSPSL